MIPPGLRWLIAQRERRWFLWTLFVVNFLGTIYGFYWYRYQLAFTNPFLDLFVPDSPTASLAFTIVLFLYLLGRTHRLLEAFAAITLFKYGIWAVVMIIWGGLLSPLPFLEALTWQHWMLIFSHLGMAAQALLYIPSFTFRWQEVSIVAGWTLLNDALDYGLDIHPWLAAELEVYDHLVGVFTVLLSLTTIFLFLTVSLKRAAGREF
jgi:uncharacterized membrane protein YpjA